MKILIVDSAIDHPTLIALARAISTSDVSVLVEPTVPKLEELPKLIPEPIPYPPCEHHSPWPPTIKRRKLKGYQK